MMGLYALKPWFAGRLAVVRRYGVRHEISPNVFTVAAVICAAAAAVSLAMLPAHFSAFPVALFLIARLACANLDGTVARESGKESPLGSVVNEVGDRAADLVVVLGLLPYVPMPLVLGALLASTLPSWMALAGAAAGVARINGGPVGKTERCLIVIIAAATGWYLPAAVAVIAGSLLTCVLRAFQIAGRCRAGAPGDGPSAARTAGAPHASGGPERPVTALDR
ncbi:CDP-alcohol phosphatidyltransferase family protein [Streptomyces noursei]|uniref:Phosphatidate cytidylyltransferase n=1 Tax=Streptomyces noursei TaxID=1971 RepID=A0A2N8PG58_STRNR|nr:CDP-alcohol phosphatidyltransferase family protein [Streptomyces noursei]PNE40007.1 hypothetical protein AOB60_02870 [Streptomyces noursei]